MIETTIIIIIIIKKKKKRHFDTLALGKKRGGHRREGVPSTEIGHSPTIFKMHAYHL